MSRFVRKLWRSLYLVHAHQRPHYTAGPDSCQRTAAQPEERRYTKLTWAAWCEANNIAKSSAEQAIVIGKDLTEAKIAKYDTITQAKIACGIVRVKEHARTKPAGKKEVAFLADEKTVLGLLTQVVAKLEMAATMKVADADREAVNEAVEKAVSLLQRIGG